MLARLPALANHPVLARMSTWLRRLLPTTPVGDSARLTVEAPTVEWAPPGHLVTIGCPNCANQAPKAALLTVNFRSPDHPAMRHWRVLRCPGCTALMFENQAVQDYADPAMLERGRVPFYVQQGAGMSMIIRPLARLNRPAGTRYLEVGCGYGFGLDYALHSKGWQGYGIDPALLSGLARDQLQLPIELRYLGEDSEAPASCDVVMGSEVIEHVPAPRDFVATLRRILRPCGILVLTTPNGDAITADLAPGVLVPMLSPGLHLVLQTRESLTRLLTEAGFAEVRIETDGHALVAFASDATIALEDDPVRLRAEYRAHLLRRAAAMPAGSDLFLGFAGRAMLECANDADIAGADAAWQLLVPACQARFGVALAQLTSLPAAVHTADLEALAGLIPLNLTAILYGRGMRELAAGAPRPPLGQLFSLAAEAADTLRRVLNLLAMEDGLTEELGWVSRLEALICDGLAGRADVPARLSTLRNAPGGQGLRSRQIAGRRVFVALVNGGHNDLARKVAEAEHLQDAHFAQQPALAQVALEDSERDAVFCLAVLDMHGRRNAQRACRRFRRVQRSIDVRISPPHDALYWAAINGEVAAADASGNPEGAFSAMRDAFMAAQRDPALLPPKLRALWLQRAGDQFMRLVSTNRTRDAQALDALAALRSALASSDPALSKNERFGLRFAMAVLDDRPGAERDRAREGFTDLAASLPPDHPLFWDAVRRELTMIRAFDSPAAACAAARRAIVRSGLPPDDVPGDIQEWLDVGR